jgi:hypothetical protein
MALSFSVLSRSLALLLRATRYSPRRSTIAYACQPAGACRSVRLCDRAQSPTQSIRICVVDLPWSESELSDSGFDATDAPRASGKPLGNVGLAGTFLPPNENNPEQNLTIQTSKDDQFSRLLTFLGDRNGRRRSSGGLYLAVFSFTETFDVNLFCFPQFTTVFTLSDWTTLLLDLVERTVNVFAIR